MKLVKIMVAALMLISVSANANLIQWDVTGDTDNSTWSMTGWVQIDSSNVVSNTDIGTSIINWMFTWTDGSTVLSNSSADGDSFAVGFALFTINDSFNVIDAVLCTKDCHGTSDAPAFYLFGDTWDASISNDDCCVRRTAETTASWGAAKNVPEPSIALLFPALLLAMTLRKRRN